MFVSESHQRLFDIFKQAIEDERKSQALYSDAVSLCEDDIMRKLFQELYADEVGHEKRLVEQYKVFRPLVTPD